MICEACNENRDDVALASHLCPPCEEAAGMTDRAQVAVQLGKAAQAIDRARRRADRAAMRATGTAGRVDGEALRDAEATCADLLEAGGALRDIVTKLAAKISG